MTLLTRQDLYSLEQYAEIRADFRKKVMAHKADRRVLLGEHLMLMFEDQLLIRYQIQEILRAEKIFEAAGIAEELEAYNPLLPDGDNWKATMMIQYDDVEERRHKLTKLIAIEDKTYVQVENQDKVYAIADEDLARENETKTSAVHFLRFQLTPGMIKAVQQGKAIIVGVDHPHYQQRLVLPQHIRDSLASDLG
jgi:hypothetical protein